MNKAPLHRGAVHEAGHAVMARILGAKLGRIKIDIADPSAWANAIVYWTEETRTPANELLVVAASRACLQEFGFSTLDDSGLQNDHNCIVDILLDRFSRDDEVGREQCRGQMEAEVQRWFEQLNVRSAVIALVLELMRTGVVEGPEAEAIIDKSLHGGMATSGAD